MTPAPTCHGAHPQGPHCTACPARVSCAIALAVKRDAAIEDRVAAAYREDWVSEQVAFVREARAWLALERVT